MCQFSIGTWFDALDISKSSTLSHMLQNNYGVVVIDMEWTENEEQVISMILH